MRYNDLLLQLQRLTPEELRQVVVVHVILTMNPIAQVAVSESLDLGRIVLTVWQPKGGHNVPRLMP